MDEDADEELARLMMGLMAMHAFIVHPDDWATGKSHYEGHEHPNKYYVRVLSLTDKYNASTKKQPCLTIATK